ncbi:hypothetical protein B0H21DRAFT_818527 [Amylocystis lapponica]|nr:hypothetical protein B0H21DRAFT_818527 [Amylocystis lapponica]
MALDAQEVFGTIVEEGWRVSVSQDWDVLGPFPIHAREQHFLSPSYPLNREYTRFLSEAIDLEASFSSAYADDGNVGWTTARSNDDGVLNVSFPNIRWSSLREYEGWAALQYHSVLRTKVTVYPPSGPPEASISPPHLLVDILQGSFFTVLPSEPKESVIVPTWYAGNIYALERSPPQTVILPIPPSETSPTSYDLFVSGDYEIRLFGDPAFNGNGVPVLSITLAVAIEPETAAGVVVREASHDVWCDFVDGWPFGDAVGVGLRSVSGWWDVHNLTLAEGLSEHIGIELVRSVRLAPTQTRIVPVRLTQGGPFHGTEIRFNLHLVSGTSKAIIPITLPITHHPQWSASSFPSGGIKTSYFYASSIPTAFLVIPPEEQNIDEPRPAVLALHGSGVDIFAAPFWISALPRQTRSWLIIPSGRTSWGLDWHGPSVQNEWGAVDSLFTILNSREAWRPWVLAEHSRVLVLGHSNGGQGSWYVAARYPDRVVAAIPAAAFIKMQTYVPLSQSRAAHFIDPAVRAILESSFTPDDNDLFLSNVADMPILAIHGGDDENVPTWHSRAYVDTLKTWNPHANVMYREDPGQPHFYPSVFANGHVQSFMRNILAREFGQQPDTGTSLVRTFTLTVAAPAESGPLHGWRIHALHVPGRLARLAVDEQDGVVEARTTNVLVFSIARLALLRGARLSVDGMSVPFDLDDSGDSGELFFSHEGGSWKALADGANVHIPRAGRLSAILTSATPLTIVVPTAHSRVLSAATRIAHALNVYHKLDAEIVDDNTAMRRLGAGAVGLGNIVVLGGAKGVFLRAVLEQHKTPFTLKDEKLYLRDRPLDHQANTALFYIRIRATRRG